MKKKLSALITRLSPPGYSNSAEKGLYILWLATAVCIAVFRYTARLDTALWYVEMASRTEGRTVCLQYFGDVLYNSLNLFPVAALLTLLAAVGRFAYFYTGSRSIYTVRRLPQKRELYLRTLALPALMAALCMAVAALLLVIFYALYVIRCPEGAMQPGQWAYLITLWTGGTNHA